MNRFWWPADQLIWEGDQYQECPHAQISGRAYDLEHEPHAWMAETWHEVTEGAWAPAKARCIQSYWCKGNAAYHARLRHDIAYYSLVNDPYRLTVITNE